MTKKTKNGSIEIPKEAKILAYHMHTKNEGEQPEFMITYLEPTKDR